MPCPAWNGRARVGENLPQAQLNRMQTNKKNQSKEPVRVPFPNHGPAASDSQIIQTEIIVARPLCLSVQSYRKRIIILILSRRPEEKSDFDFWDDPVTTNSGARRVQGAAKPPRGSAKKKTTSLDGILSSMRRHRKLDEMDVKTTANQKTKRSPS